MFCPKCGAENPNGSKFCGVCGTPFATPQGTTPAPQQTVYSNPGTYAGTGQYGGGAVIGSSYASGMSVALIAAAVLLLVAGICLLQPWASFNLSAFPNSSSAVAVLGPSIGFTLPTLTSVVDLFAGGLDKAVQTAMSLSSSLSSDVLEAKAMADSLGTARIVCTIIWIVWVATLALVAIAIYEVVSSKGSNHKMLVPAGALCAVDSLGWIIAMGVIDGSARDTLMSTSGQVITGLVTATPFVWVTLLCGVAAVVVAVLHKQGILR